MRSDINWIAIAVANITMVPTTDSRKKLIMWREAYGVSRAYFSYQLAVDRAAPNVYAWHTGAGIGPHLNGRVRHMTENSVSP